MNENQIIRIPYKYSELINTMEDCECWKLMKALFSKNTSQLKWLSLTYYNIIIVDIINMENQVNIWKNNWIKWAKYWYLWWRPKKEITPEGDIKKTPPRDIKKTPNIIKDKISKDKVKENKINKDIIINNNITDVMVFWNIEINNMQQIIKQTIENNWMIYKPWKQERNRIKNILTAKEFWITCENAKMTREQFVVNIINLASKLKYSKKIYNWVDLYNNYAAVYNKALETKNDLLQPKKLREIW